MASTINASTTGLGGVITSGDSSGILSLQTNGTTAVTVDASQNVGIGITSPVRKFHVYNTSDGFISRFTGGSSNNVNIGIFGSTGGSFGSIGTESNHPFNIFTNGVDAVSISVSGNVGIGTTTPAYGLDVQGSTNTSIRVYSPNYSSLRVHNSFTGTGNSDGLLIEMGYTDALIYNYESANLKFGTNNTEAMRITSGGYLLLNTTSQGYGLFSSSRLTVGNGQNGDGICVGGLNEAQSAYTVQANNNTGTRYAMYIANGSSSAIGTISFTSSATAFNTSSDYRLKNTIAPMIGALDKVSQLKPVTYKWNIDGSASQGFIAHELQAVVPECVTGEKDAVDENGNPRYQGIDTSFLVATLTAAIQELSTQLTELKAEVATLRGTQA